jgi:hypothetical protein
MLPGRKIAYLSAATRPRFVSHPNKCVKRIALAAGYARRYGVANERFWPVAPLANSRFMTAVSTGQRNSLVKYISGRVEAQSFSRALV